MSAFTDRELPLRRVALYSSGVGYFERDGELSGATQVRLPFAPDAMSDVLKSLLVDDPAGGSLSVSYATADALGATLRALKPDVSDNPGFADLLNRLRGAQIEVDCSSGRFVGRVLGVEVRPGGDEPPEVVLSLLTDEVVVVLPATTILSYRLLGSAGAAAARDLNRALDALLVVATSESRDLVVQLPACASRQVKLSYVTEAPIWKAAYRLNLAADPPLLQGWAVIDNASDVDWNSVELSLFVGRPASFTQPLYEAYHVPREEVPLAVAGSAPARQYEAAYDVIAAGEANYDMRAVPLAAKSRGAVMSAPVPAPIQAIGRAAGEQFAFTFPQPVTLRCHESVMMPFVQGNIGVRPVSIVDGSVRPSGETNPGLGLRLTNNTSAALPAGAITVFDDNSYAGDALIEFLPPGAQRLVSYGDDLAVRVSQENASSQRVASLRLAHGLIEVRIGDHWRTEYRLVNEADKARTIWVQHPRNGDATLEAPTSAAEETAQYYRFEVEVPAHRTKTLRVVTQYSRVESIGLADDRTLDYLSGFGGELPPQAKAALAQAAAIRARQSRAEHELAALGTTEAALVSDQARVRETLAVVGVGTRSGAVYQKRLEELEDRLVTLGAKQEALRQAAEAAGAELRDFIAAQDFEEDSPASGPSPE